MSPLRPPPPGPRPGTDSPVINSDYWKGSDSPYGRPVPLAYGVTWVRGIQVYSGEPFLWYAPATNAAVVVPVYAVDKDTGEVSIAEEGQVVQSAVLVLCERATTILDIIKDGVSINSGMIDDDPITTVTQRLRMLSGRIPGEAGIIPPTGEEHGYFHGGTGSAVAHTRFSRTANLGAAPYTYSGVARVDFCALGIGTRSSRPRLQFKVQALLAASSTVGAHPADVLVDLWTRAGKDPDDINVETYYRAFVTGGGGSGSSDWRVGRTIDSQTSAKELMQALLDETFSTVVKKEDGTIMVVPRNVASGTATAIGVNDFVPGGAPPVTVELKQASDRFNCFPVIYEVTAASGSHTVKNEDTTFAVAHPFSGTETIRRAPTVTTKWVSTPEHALNLSHLLAWESFSVQAVYKFRLHKRWVLLQEHDLLSLTEPHLGLSAKVVKIRRISEDGSGVISIEADEWLGQVSYTTPEVDPFDGFQPLPGNPTDPVSDAVAAMGDDGFLTPVEKPAFFQAVTNIWHAVREGNDAGSGDIDIHGTNLNAASTDFYDYLQILGFEYGWVDIDRVWTTTGDRAAQRALLAAWMAETTTVVAADYRAAFGAVETAIADARVASFRRPLGSIMGAVGDGTTDDTAALQAMLSSGDAKVIGAAGAICLVSKAGDVALNSHYPSDLTSYCLKIPPGVFFDLNGATIKLADGENAAILINENPTASYGSSPGSGYTDADLGAGNGWLDGNQANQTYTAASNTGQMPCIYLAGVIRPRVVGLKVKNSRDFAGRFVNCDGGFFDALEAYDCAADGWSFGTSGDAPLELRGSQIGIVSSNGCEAQAGWASSPQGNGAIFTVHECQVGQVIARSCAGGIKIQNTSLDSSFGSLTFIGGANGTNNSGVKVQGSTSLGVMPDRISIGLVTCVGTHGPGLYLHEAERVSIGSYTGEGCGTSGDYSEIWIDSVFASIQHISSLDSVTTAGVIALRAFFGTKLVKLGTVMGRNPAGRVLGIGAHVFADIGFIAGLSDGHSGAPYEAVAYNSADAMVAIGDIVATNQAPFVLNATPSSPGYWVLRSALDSSVAFTVIAASGESAISFATNGARFKLGSGANAYLASTSGTNVGTPADFYAGSYGPWSEGLVSLRGTGVEIGSGGPNILGGAVDPSAGAGIAAPQGSIYLRTNGGASTTLYVKTGGGNTAWTAK